MLILQGRVAQWTRVRGYEPRCRGFESLLARLDEMITAKCRDVALLRLYNFMQQTNSISTFL